MRIKHAIIFTVAVICLLPAFAKNAYDYYAKRAEEAFNQGQYQDALDYARHEIADYEKNPNGYYQAALSLYILDSPGQALPMLDKAWKLAKKDRKLSSDCALIKAGIHCEMGDTAMAVKTLDEELKRDSKNLDLIIEKISLLLSTDVPTALKEIKKAKKLNPADPRAYRYSANIYTGQNKYQEALDEINYAISLDTTDAYSYAFRGVILKMQEKSPEWIKDMLHGYILDESSALPMLCMVYCESEEDRDEIIKEIDRASNESLLALKADLLYEWSRYEEAVKAYQELIDKGIANADNYYILAQYLQSINEDFKAYNIVSLGLEKYPDDKPLNLTKAQIGITVGKAAEVLDLLDSLIQCDPEDESLYAEKGKALLSMGRYSEACEPLEIAHTLSPTSINTLLYADALNMSGNEKRAASLYQAILKIPEDRMAAEALMPEFIYAQAYACLGDKERAMEWVDKRVSNTGEDRVPFQLLILTRLGCKKEAVETLKNFADSNPDWNPIYDINNYALHPLHSEPEFVELLKERDFPVKQNPDTGLLEFFPYDDSRRMGGASYDEMRDVIANNPKDWINKVNAMCPVDMGSLGQLLSLDVDEKNKTIIFNFRTSPELKSIYITQNDPDLKEKAQQAIGLKIIAEHPEWEKLEATIIYSFVSHDGREKAVMKFDPKSIKELTRLAKSPDEIDRLMIEYWIMNDNLDSLNENNPYPAKAYLENNWYCLEFPIPEEDGFFSSVEIFQDDLRKVTLQHIKSDYAMRSKLPTFIRHNIGIKYRIVSTESGRRLEIVITPEELKELLNE